MSTYFQTDLYKENAYRIGSYRSPTHAGAIQTLRAVDRKNYENISGERQVSSAAPEKITSIESMLREDRAKRLDSAKVNAAEIMIKISQLSSDDIAVVHDVIELKRQITGDNLTKEYTSGELEYAYEVIKPIGTEKRELAKGEIKVLTHGSRAEGAHKEFERESIRSLEIKMNSLLDGFSSYQIVFKRSCEAIDKAVVIKLNKEKTRLAIITPQKKEIVLENDGIVIRTDDYSRIRTELQNKAGKLETSELTERIGKQVINYLIQKNYIANREQFINAFKMFLDEQPTIPKELEDYRECLIRLEEVDINESSEHDRVLSKLGMLHEKMLKSLSSYKKAGDEYIASNPQVKDGGGTLRIKFQLAYPEESKKLEEMLKILDRFERGKLLDEQLEIVCKKLGLGEHSAKLKQYFQVKKASKLEPEPSIRAQALDEIKLPEPVALVGQQDRDSDIKKLEDLLEEIEEQSEVMEEQLEQIRAACYRIDEHYESGIKEWSKETIRSWANERKGKLGNTFIELSEALAVMDRANELATGGHRLRDTQKIAILMFMQTHFNEGHISQISTGEGKTTIISFVQAIKVLQGYKKHVITSNGVLAVEGVENRKNFYNLLGLSAAHNNPDEKYVKGARDCYKADIVYGSIGNFQFDWLKHSFERLETLGV